MNTIFVNELALPHVLIYNKVVCAAVPKNYEIACSVAYSYPIFKEVSLSFVTSVSHAQHLVGKMTKNTKIYDFFFSHRRMQNYTEQLFK